MGDARQKFWSSPEQAMSPEERRAKREQARKRTQKTRPKKGKPVEIPVPKRGDVMGDLSKIARPAKRKP